MPRLSLAAALLCLLAGPALAEDAVTLKSPNDKAAAKRPAVRAPVKPTSVAAESDLLPRSVFDVLLGEMALQRGDFETALAAYTDLAKRSQDAKALERAIEIANHTRQFELSLELARQWARVDPQSFKAQQAVTTALMLLNRTDELGAQIAVMLERDKERLAENLLYLNRLLARQPDKQAVLRVVDKVTQPYRNLAEAHYALAVAALAAGDQVRARAESARALDLRTDWEAAALLRAQVLAKSAPGDAIELLDKFVGDNPKAFDARLTLGRLLLSEKRYNDARRQFDLVLESYPNAPEVLYPAAMLALQQSDLEGGKAFLERLLASSFPDKSTVHFFLGQIAEETKNPEAALTHYRQVAAGDQFIPARARSAQIALQQTGLDAALKLLRETQVQTNEEKASLAMTEAGLLRDAKRFAEAFGVLERALEAQPTHIDLLYDSALVAERLGKFDVLEGRLKKVLALKPDHAHALNALGFTWADRNERLDEAYQLISKALALAPNDPFIMDSLGWVYFRQGKLSEALDTLEAAYKLRPDPEIAAHLGEVLWKMERRGDAGKVWNEASQKHPANEVLSEVIKKHKP